MNAYELHTYELRTCEIREVYAGEVHACDIYIHKMHAWEWRWWCRRLHERSVKAVYTKKLKISAIDRAGLGVA